MFFFKSGTNTDLATFKDNLESIPNTNPVLLDAAGRIPNIFFSGSARVILTADDLETGEIGKQIFERDSVGGEKELGDFTLWDITVTYDLNDIVEGSNGEFYKSLSNANQANDPLTNEDKWELFKLIGVWNTNITYSIGDVVLSTLGNLWKALTATAANDPETDDGTNWVPAIGSLPVIPQTTSGTLTALRINELQDGGSFTIPVASSVNINQTINISQPDEFVSFEPVITVSGGDTITDSTGTDTSITFDNNNSIEIRLTSDGVSDWRL